MLYTEEEARACIRNRDGKRVFYLGKEDTLTPAARDFLQRERVQILAAEEAQTQQYRLVGGGTLAQKPEYMTHLQGNLLVSKAHPRIGFRGALDALQAKILLCQLELPEVRQELGEILALCRKILRCEVMDEALAQEKLCGFSPAQLRERSHYPQKFYGVAHFMPQCSDGAAICRLNLLRCVVRDAERRAVEAFVDADGVCRREDILQAMNRMSSMVYILMIRLKKQSKEDG